MKKRKLSYSLLCCIPILFAVVFNEFETAPIAYFSEIIEDGAIFHSTLIVLDPETRAEVSKVIDGMIEPTRFSWSPDHTKIALSYAKDGSTNYTLSVIDLETDQPESLVNEHNTDIFTGSFSPVIDQILYTTNTIYSSSPSNLFLYSVPDKTSTPITKGPLSVIGAFWSPDGNYIAVNGFENPGDFPHSDIYLVDLRTRQTVNITRSPNNENFSNWSPDSSKIAFDSDESGSTQVHVMDANGRNQRQITAGSHRALAPQWVFEGTHLMYLMLDREVPTAKLVLFDLATDQEQILIETAYIDAFTVSPSRDQIAYTSRQTNNTQAKLCVLHITSGEEWCAKTPPMISSAIALG